MGRRPVIAMTEFDIVTLDESLQMIKALIPYLDYSMQKSMSLMIRIKELLDTVQYYNNPHSFVLNKGACSGDEMMKDIAQYCPCGMQDTINMMSQMMQFSNIMNAYNNMEQSAEFANIMNTINDLAKENGTDGSSYTGDNSGSPDSGPYDTLWNFMDNEQQQLYDEYMQKLDNIEL